MEPSRVVVLVLRQICADRFAFSIQLYRYVLPIAVVIEEQRAVAVGIVEPVLHVNPAVFAWVDVNVGSPIPRIVAAAMNGFGKASRGRGELGRPGKDGLWRFMENVRAGQQPRYRCRTILVRSIEDDDRREAPRERLFLGVEQPVAVVVTGDERGGTLD